MKVAIIGAGIVGLATANALNDRGASLAIYERGVPGGGQSGGSGRIFRHTHEDARLVPIAQRSLALWREWEQRFDVELVSSDGAVAVGPTVSERLEAMRAFDHVDVELIDGADVPQVLPLSAGYDGPALIDRSAGAIRTETAIAQLLDRVRCQVIAEEVYAIRHVADGRVEVTSGGGSSDFDQVVICAGRGTGALVRDVGGFSPLPTDAHLRLTFAVRGGPLRQMACLLDGTATYGAAGAYGTPQPGGRTYAVGLSMPIAVADDGGIADPAAAARVRDATSAYVRAALPGLEPNPIGSRTCWITRPPWGDDGLAMWQRGGVRVVAGHNLFKLAPWIGAVVADAVVADEPCDLLDPARQLGRRSSIA